MNAYVERVYEGLKQRNAHEKEYLQAAWEILSSLAPVFDAHPEYEKAGLLLGDFILNDNFIQQGEKQCNT